ncbi:MAG: DUF2322 family protein [Nitrosomonadales bacterium]|nr:DUF2322 family protein [Nitrosomonadales bacterium]
MNKFNDILATLENAGHVQCIALFNRDGSPAGNIENKPGSAGSVRVYHHLYKKFGKLDAAAAREGLALYAEHTRDAQEHPGKHPNIDRLFAVIADNTALSVEILAQ